MARIRPVSTFALIPPVVLLDALAWYGMMSMLSLFMIGSMSEGGLEMDHMGASSKYALLHGVVAVGSLLAGLIAIGVGPHMMMVLGLATAFAGVVTLGICDTTTVWIALVLAGVGQGLARPGVYASAATAFGYPAEQLRNALFVTCWASFNLGAVLGPLGASSLYTAFGYRAAFHLSGAVMLLAMLLASALAIVVFARRRQPEPPPDTARKFDGRILGLAVGVAMLALVPWAGYSVVTVLQIDLVHAGATPVDLSTLFTINPLIIIGASLLLVPVLLLLHWLKVNVPTLLFVGIGLVLMGIGFVPLLVAPEHLLLPFFIAATAIISFGELLTGPFLMSRLLGDHHWRIGALVAGVWLAAVAGISAAIHALAYSGMHLASAKLVGGAVAGVMVVVGLLFAAVAFPTRKFFVPVDAGTAPAESPADLQTWEREEFGSG
jgi:dipeptide/tripeptide permease